MKLGSSKARGSTRGPPQFFQRGCLFAYLGSESLGRRGYLGSEISLLKRIHYQPENLGE